MTNTLIECTDSTWNPISGCSRVSEGCTNCYAETYANRFKGPGQPYEGLIAKSGQWNGEIKLVLEKLEEPLHWKKPRIIFVNSMSDLFHENVPFDFVDQVFAVMALCPQHTFQILTKRPERMREFLNKNTPLSDLITAAKENLTGINHRHIYRRGWPLGNVWLGVSVEDQQTADERIWRLLDVPAAIRFISAEPLLGPISIKQSPIKEKPGWAGLHWIIAGGESGKNARPMDYEWIAGLRDQCVASGVPFFFKQWGEWHPVMDGSTIQDKRDFVQIGKQRHRIIEADYYHLERVGKKVAGNKLDGQTYQQYPSKELIS